jgi:(p)ppGpp synthase/HD superfamily hydrolase
MSGGNMTQPTVEDAILLATVKHRGQLDKAGQPYILHPLRVMLRLKTTKERIVGVLHDVVEDCGVTLDELRELGYPEEVVVALEALTKREGENYDDFIDRILEASVLAQHVKIADLEDNSDLSRLETVTASDEARAAKYERALARLRARAS